LVVVGQRLERRGERVLEHVLGVLARAENVPAEGEKRPMISIKDCLEGSLVASLSGPDEPLVAQAGE